MTRFLLQIHIGPMQAFIATARRTRDLWFGSWLMSELSKAAARGIAEQAGEPALIFPSASMTMLQPDSELGVANRLVATVANPEQAARVAKHAVDRRYDELVAAAGIKTKIASDGWSTADAQLRSFLEFYWASYLLNDNYPYARAYTDTLLTARKNSRTFQPINWNGSGRPKSSLDGRMETVIPRNLGATEMYHRFRARPGEQLSGVDLLKRLGQAADPDLSRFPSTSHMAAIPLRSRLQAKAGDPKVKQKWQVYLASLPPEVTKQEIIYHRFGLPILDRLDGSLLFESRLLDYVDKGELPPLKKKLGDFLHEAGIGEDDLPSYYALLVGDGDSMGAAIDGMSTPVEHQTFSQKLAAFSNSARQIVEEHDGAVVYAGGDDVLALLPLHTAVAAAAALAQYFRQSLPGLTFSAGIAIVHHLEPLEDALQLARQAEKEAKGYEQAAENGQVSQKNALAIILNKRSGEPRLVVGQWGEIDARLLQFAAYYRQNELPHGLAHQLREMFLRLGGTAALKANPALKEVLAKEAERIIKRKEGSEAAAAYAQTAVTRLDYRQTNIETFSGELIIAAHIAKAQELAQEVESV